MPVFSVHSTDFCEYSYFGRILKEMVVWEGGWVAGELVREAGREQKKNLGCENLGPGRIGRYR